MLKYRTFYKVLLAILVRLHITMNFIILIDPFQGAGSFAQRGGIES
jgi:hypothetical protein